MDLEKPIGFKVMINIDGDKVNKRVLEIMDLTKARKEKVKTSMTQAPQPPLFLKINYSENMEMINQLNYLVQRHQGGRELKIIVTSKLQDILLESNLKVASSIEKELQKIKEIEIIA